MSMRSFYEALVDRLEASDDDTFRNGTAYAHSAPPNIRHAPGLLPVVTFVANWEQDDTFGENSYAPTLIVTIVDHYDNGLGPLFDAYDRIYGDGDPPNDAPTFGLHRHRLNFGANPGDAGVLVFQRCEPLFLEDPTMRGFTIEFSTQVDKG